MDAKVTAKVRLTTSIRQGSPCLQSEARLKHVPILHPKVGEENAIEGVRTEVEAVAAVLSGVKVVRSPDHRAVLSNNKKKRTEKNSQITATPTYTWYVVSVVPS